MSLIERVQCTLCLLVIFIVATILSYGDNVLAEDLELSKLSKNVGAPTLKFLYCYSCGYRKMFDQYVTIINEKYPYILVDGANYDPPGLNMMLARGLGALKMVVILCILSGINIFEYINQPRPSWWLWCTENKLYACMMLFFLCNLVEGQLIQSGAFEITLNDIPVWSKLETGRIPQPAELFEIIDNHMRFDNKVELKGFAK